MDWIFISAWEWVQASHPFCRWGNRFEAQLGLGLGCLSSLMHSTFFVLCALGVFPSGACQEMGPSWAS